MSNSSPQLEDLNSLNREIAALVRAGVPIELGLRGLAGSGVTRFERFAGRLAERMADGQSLSDALSTEHHVSPVYVSVIEAGLSSGKLPEALESLATSGQLLQETRRRIALAAIYPAICTVVAYGLFCFFLHFVAHRILVISEFVPDSWPVRLLRMLQRNQDFLTMVIPSAVLAVVVVAFLLRNGLTRGIWQWFTSFRWVIGRSLNWAQFTELLALQVAHKNPLANAIVLAADSTSDARLQRQARTVSSHLRDGSSFAEALKSAPLLPPLVRWMLATGEKQGTLEATLRQLSDIYRRRALYRAAIVKVWLPVVMTIGFTGTVGLAYGLGFIIPLRAFLQSLAVG